MSFAFFLVLALSTSAIGGTANGKTSFTLCAACHLQDAKGVPGAFPPLVSRLGPLVATPEGREYLVLVVHAGLMGEIEIDGVSYRGVMPAQGAQLGDEGVAAALNCLLKQFNATTLPKRWRPFSADEVAGIKARHTNVTAAQLYQMRSIAFGAMKKK